MLALVSLVFQEWQMGDWSWASKGLLTQAPSSSARLCLAWLLGMQGLYWRAAELLPGLPLLLTGEKSSLCHSQHCLPSARVSLWVP